MAWSPSSSTSPSSDHHWSAGTHTHIFRVIHHFTLAQKEKEKDWARALIGVNQTFSSVWPSFCFRVGSKCESVLSFLYSFSSILCALHFCVISVSQCLCSVCVFCERFVFLSIFLFHLFHLLLRLEILPSTHTPSVSEWVSACVHCTHTYSSICCQQQQHRRRRRQCQYNLLHRHLHLFSFLLFHRLTTTESSRKGRERERKFSIIRSIFKAANSGFGNSITSNYFHVFPLLLRLLFCHHHHHRQCADPSALLSRWRGLTRNNNNNNNSFPTKWG